MPSQEVFDELKGRIVELENALNGRRVRRDVSDISPEELEAFKKVRDLLAGDWGEFCGINDCFKCVVSCVQCSLCVTRCVLCTPPCVVECTCGPCIMQGPGPGGPGRFGGLGS